MKKAYNTVWREGLWRKVTESDGQEKEMDRTTNWLMILCVRGPRAHADQQINLTGIRLLTQSSVQAPRQPFPGWRRVGLSL